jgi:hypothetical protein
MIFCSDSLQGEVELKKVFQLPIFHSCTFDLTIAPTVYSDAGCFTNPHVQHRPSRSSRFFHHFDLLWRHERRARYTGSRHSRVRLHAIRPTGVSLMHLSPPTTTRRSSRSAWCTCSGSAQAASDRGRLGRRDATEPTTVMLGPFSLPSEVSSQ